MDTPYKREIREDPAQTRQRKLLVQSDTVPDDVTEDVRVFSRYDPWNEDFLSDIARLASRDPWFDRVVDVNCLIDCLIYFLDTDPEFLPAFMQLPVSALISFFYESDGLQPDSRFLLVLVTTILKDARFEVNLLEPIISLVFPLEFPTEACLSCCRRGRNGHHIHFASRRSCCKTIAQRL
jgi:hypothetical protein